MLKALKIDNFKSLKNTEITLGKNSFLIGMNGSGKTTFLQLIDFLSVISLGKKEDREAKGFYKNSEAFAYLAREEHADIAIFFVDADKDSPFERNKQVKAGLEKYGYIETGVPMIPTKISEAWLLCCLNDYKNCEKYEEATTDKTSQDYPKNRCEASGYTRH